MRYPAFKTMVCLVIFLSQACFNGVAYADGPSIRKPMQTISVFVSIPPQAYFVERIGGKRVSVDVMVMPGENPAVYAPTPDQISRLARAKLFFTIGVPFERSLMPRIERVAKNLIMIDTRKGIDLRRMTGRNHDDKQNGHSKNNNDPHIWLSPVLVKKQAETIYKALAELDPQGANKYEANFMAFSQELERLNQKISAALLPVKGQTFFVFHPAFGYFADTYGLNQMAVEVEGKIPKGKDLSVFIKKAKKENVRVVFVQSQFDSSAARKIAAAINGAVVPLDPLARDYIANLEDMADKIRDALH
jgi:zinc transport system substrate-binding protein